MNRIDAQQLTDFVQLILQSAGISEEEGSILASEWVYADLTGYSSHGVAKLADSLARLEKGIVEKETRIKRIHESETTAVLDANNGWGQVASQKAVDLAIEKGKAKGTAWIAVRNSNHHGRTGYWTAQIARAGLIGFATTNTSPVMVAHGSVESTLGTNPISFAIPAGDQYPVILDIATSTQARGKIMLAKKRGESIPDNWAIDRQGNPTEDPIEALAGSLLPMAGHKGSGLAIIVDILSGVLTGSLFGAQVPSFYDDPVPQRIGHLFGAIDVSRFMPMELFLERLEEKKREIRESQTADGVEQVRMPGDLESAKYDQYRKQGVPISDEIVAELRELADTYGQMDAFQSLIDKA